jgi:hypothetical protein
VIYYVAEHDELVIVRVLHGARGCAGDIRRVRVEGRDKNVTVPFLQGLKETGYVDGQNVAVEYRWGDTEDIFDWSPPSGFE